MRKKIKKPDIRKSKKKLPNKPSELIRVAVADLEKVEKDKRFSVNMRRWMGKRGRKCEVCFAGSVLAKTVGVPLSVHDASPGEEVKRGQYAVGVAVTADQDGAGEWGYYVNSDVSAKMFALNDFRTGDIAGALAHLKIRRPKGLPDQVSVSGHGSDESMVDGTWIVGDNDMFRADMIKLAYLLEQHGL